MISAVSEATVPKFSVIVRKAYGAGLYAMAGPGFEPDATIALPTAKIAVMGAEAAVNAVHAKRLNAIADNAERAETVGPTFMNTLPVAFAEPEDISDAVAFLASDEAKYVTGLQMKVDAGNVGR